MISFFSIIQFNLILFVIALWGILVIRKNLLVVLIALELLAISVSLNFVIFSIYLDDIIGQIFSLNLLAIIGAESAIGLALLLLLFRLKYDISIDIISTLKG